MPTFAVARRRWVWGPTPTGWSLFGSSNHTSESQVVVLAEAEPHSWHVD